MSDQELGHLERLILDSLGEAVFTVDESFRITSFNAAAERLTRVPREKALGMRCQDVFRADICHDACAIRKTLESGTPVRNMRVRIMSHHEEEVFISVNASLLFDQDGRRMGALEVIRDISELETLRREIGEHSSFHGMVGASRPMQRIFASAPALARGGAPVLIQGPPGSGRATLARVIHDLSGRSRGPMVSFQCHGDEGDTSTMEERLLGPDGSLALACRGSLLMKNLEALPPRLQERLADLLDDGTQRARLLATMPTPRGPPAPGLLSRGLQSLFQTATLQIPPLSERMEDLPHLVEHFLGRIAEQRRLVVEGVADETLAALAAWWYPGNVGELEAILERAALMVAGARLEPEHLPPEVLAASRQENASRRPGTRAILEAPPSADGYTASAPEATRLLQALQSNGWNRQATARQLGVSRSTLWRRMKEYGLA